MSPCGISRKSTVERIRPCCVALDSAGCRFVGLAEHEEFLVNAVRHSYRKQRIIMDVRIMIMYEMKYGLRFAVNLFLRNTADIIFRHCTFPSFKKFPARGPEVRVAGCIVCGSNPSLSDYPTNVNLRCTRSQRKIVYVT